MTGPRVVLLAPFGALGDFVRKQGGRASLKQPISELATIKWLSTSSPTSCQNAIASGVPMAMCTVGPGDVLYIPGGTIRFEKFLSEVWESGLVLKEGLRDLFSA